MALTPTAIDRLLDEVATVVDDKRKVVAKGIQNVAAAATELDDIPTTYAELITAINELQAGDAWADLAKARLAQYAAEYGALKTVADEIAAKIV